MKHWTDTAESRLEEYLRQRSDRENLHGEDAEELRSDLRRHIHEEAENDPSISAVGVMQLENLLGKLDAGYKLPPAITLNLGERKQRSWYLWLLGVFLPAIVVVIEASTSLCASEIFDPIPTWWHFLLLIAVPMSNACLLSQRAQSQQIVKKLNPILAGCAFGVSLFYALIFLPMTVIGVMALIFFLFGLLPLSPLLSWLSTWRIARRIARQSGTNFRRIYRLTAIAIFSLLAIGEIPGLWTLHQLTNACSTDTEISQPAIAKLRQWHSQKTLINACYASPWGRRHLDMSDWISEGWLNMLTFSSSIRANAIHPQTVRSVFYQVTGENFNSFPSPAGNKNNYFGRDSDVVEEDWDHGGDAVAGRTAHLDLTESRYDGHLDQQSGISYGEWTMVFHNSSTLPREARCQIRVPAGGKVSRLTLWINGEPCEAAFGTVSQVKAAYKEVAVVQRRDPVLVNLVGPDTYMMQCFPVPVQGDMKIRIGITSSMADNRSQLPYILEKNFGIAKNLSHAIWLQSKHPFDIIDPTVTSHADGDGQSLTLDSAEMNLSIQGKGENARADTLWCRDPFIQKSESNQTPSPFLIAKNTTVPTEPIKKWIVVVDGSTAMERHASMISRSLDGIPADVIFAEDQPRDLQPGELAAQPYRGGFDNEPAIHAALQRARNQPGSAILWLHAAQSIELTKKERILQLLERGTTRIPFYAATLSVGANRLLEAIGRKGAVQILPLHATYHEGMRNWLQEKMQPHSQQQWTFSHSSEAPTAPALETTDQLARFWAMQHVEKTNDAVLAARYQLVTHVSGAVVLENAAQYARHGLTQVDASTVSQIPNIPEPTSILLFLSGALSLLLRRKR